MSHTRLGHFELHRRLGVGGMGQVFEGVHAPSGHRVALKTPRAEPDARTRRMFMREAQAASSLRAPGIVRTLDYGALPHAVEVDGARVEAGAPYVVMSRVDGEPLDRVALLERLGGDPVAGARAVLEPLAVAHAAGVLHLDLKPANVLARAGGLVTLIDFGLARWLGDTRDGVGGTLAYMAPEQTLGDLGFGVGPWSDVFALGVMVFEWLVGHPPFVGLGVDAIQRAKRAGLRDEALDAIPPRWRPWLAAALAPSPHARFAFAADALDALDALADGSGDLENLTPAPTKCGAPAGSSFWRSSSIWTPSTTTQAPTDEAAPSRYARSGLALPRSAPREVAAPERALQGVGLGVLEWRATPLLGRDACARALWALSRDALGGRRARVAWLRGDPGVGKSHVARWLARALHRYGVATWTIARDADEPMSRAASRALSTWAQTHGADDVDFAARASARLRRMLGVDGEDLTRALGLMRPPARARQQEADLLETFSKVVLASARARPTLLVLEDEDLEDAHAMAMVQALGERAADLPLLMIRTNRAASPGALAPPDLEVELGPLPPEAHTALIALALDLDPSDALTLHTRTLGNPLFTLELLKAWARRGALAEGARGFALDEDTSGPLPRRILEACRARLQPALDDPGCADLSLHLATLGHGVDAATLDALLDAWGDPRAGATHIERLRALDLLDPTEEGWRWSHRMLHEALEAERDLLPDPRGVFATCARSLRALTRHDAAHTRRLIELSMDAGDLDAALTDMREYVPSAPSERSDALLARLERRVALAPTPARLAHVALYRASLASLVGDLSTAREHLDASRSLGLPDDHVVLLRADLLHLDGLVISGDYTRALELATGLLTRAADHPREERTLQCVIADAYTCMGAPERALGHLERALGLCRLTWPELDSWDAAWLRYQLANTYDELGRADDAITQCELAESFFERTRDGSGLGSCLVIRALIASRGDHHQGALDLYERASVAMRAWGDGAWVLGLDGQARMLLHLGRTAEARALVTQLGELVGVNEFVLDIDDLALLLAAREGDWVTWDSVAAGFDLHAFSYDEAAAALETCAEFCADQGDSTRQAWALDQARAIRNLVEEQT